MSLDEFEQAVRSYVAERRSDMAVAHAIVQAFADSGGQQPEADRLLYRLMGTSSDQDLEFFVDIADIVCGFVDESLHVWRK